MKVSTGLAIAGLFVCHSLIADQPLTLSSPPPAPMEMNTPLTAPPALVDLSAPPAQTRSASALQKIRIPASLDVEEEPVNDLQSSKIQFTIRKLKCMFKAPDALLKAKVEDKDLNLFSYRIKRPENETIELGRTLEGVRFSITRGGCVESGEIYLMEAEGGSHSLQDVKFWFMKMAKLLKDLGLGSSVSLLRDRSSLLEAILDKYPEYQFGTSIKIDQDTVEVDAAEFPNDVVRVQLSVNMIL